MIVASFRCPIMVHRNLSSSMGSVPVQTLLDILSVVGQCTVFRANFPLKAPR